MEPGAYIQLLQYLRRENRSVSPNELSTAIGKSRVTTQSTLKRLIKNGWVEKIGESPKTTYRSLDLALVPRETQENDIPLLQKAERNATFGLLEQFIDKTTKIREQ